MIVGLQACSSLPPIPPHSSSATNGFQTQMAKEDIRYFTAWGKLAINRGKEGGQLRFYWHEDHAGSDIKLEHALGSLVASITRSSLEHPVSRYWLTTIETSTPQPYDSLEDLLTHLFPHHGINLPAGMIKDMLLGQSQEAWRTWQQQDVSRQAMTWQLEMADLPVNLDEPTNLPSRYSLPQRIIINAPPFSMRVFIEHWLVHPSSLPKNP